MSSTLNNLINRKSMTVLGLNAGTSGDGLDLAAVKIALTGKKLSIKFLKGKTVPYPDKLKSLVGDAIHNKIKSMDEIIILDRMLGNFYGEQAGKFQKSLGRSSIKVDLIASHGQTVRHLPGKVQIGRKVESGSLQLGFPEAISMSTGLVTVGNFRQSDIAAGGEGAPITSDAMWHLFNSKKEDRILLNIGGIANFFLFPKGGTVEKVLAADCGPGNSLIDILTKQFFGKGYDKGGSIASQGHISIRLLTILLADKFLQGKYGPSTGRERFGERFARKIIRYGGKLRLNQKDILATTTELTAVGITNALINILGKYPVEQIYIFGGGLSNKFLVKCLKQNLPGIGFVPVSKLGYNPDYLEAICYAVMGAKTIYGMTSNLAHITGADKNGIAGRITQPA